MNYCWKKEDAVISVMASGKRMGIVPEHGYCSGRPAGKFGEAMQLGNGKMSVAVYGDPYEEQAVFGHERLYMPLLETVPPPPLLAGEMGEIRRLLKEGKGFEAADLASDLARQKGGHEGLLIKPQNASECEKPVEGFIRHSGARMNIRMESCGKAGDYLRCVDFVKGEAKVCWTDGAGEWKRESFVSREDTVYLQRLRVPEGTEAKLYLKLDAFEEEGEHEWERMSLPEEVAYVTAAENNTLLFEGWYKDGISTEGYAVALLVSGGCVDVHPEEEGLCVKAKECVVVMGCIRHYEVFTPGCGKSALSELKKFEASLAERPDDFIYEAVMNRNLKSHGRLMQESLLETAVDEKYRRMTVEELIKDQHMRQTINPLLLEKFYDAGRYFQIITTGELPPMIGQWNINVNLQVCGGNMTGLQELMIPYFRFVEKNIPDFRENARVIYGCKGMVADIHPDMHNGLLYHFSRTWPHQFYTAGTGWMYHEFYYYYLTTGDRQFLEKHVVPGLREIAEFYDGFLTDLDKEGNYIFYPCLSPENSPAGAGPATINAVMDIMVCREVLENLLHAEKILGISDNKRERWEDILSHLPTLLLDEEGGLKEWAWDSYKENYNHRCVSHHYDVWPADKINWEETPKLAQAVLISNRKRPLENDSCHGIMHRLFTAVRLRDGQYVRRLLSMLFELGFVNCNMTTNHYPYRVVFPDMLGSMPALAGELLVYSKPGRICFLPLAGDLIPVGNITGIRLYTLIRLDEMKWDLNVGSFRARLFFLEDQEVEIWFGERIGECTVNGKIADTEEEKLWIQACRGQTVSLEAELKRAETPLFPSGSIRD